MVENFDFENFNQNCPPLSFEANQTFSQASFKASQTKPQLIGQIDFFSFTLTAIMKNQTHSKKVSVTLASHYLMDLLYSNIEKATCFTNANSATNVVI